MRRILVTAINGNVSNGILKILKETKDQVFGCDIYDYPVGMDKVICYWKSDMATEPCYIDNLCKKCNEYRITHLIPVNEKEIEAISLNIQRFIDMDIKVMINDTSIVDMFLDKYTTYQRLGQIDGVDVPNTYIYSDFIEDGEKYIVKLRKSCGSKFLKIISSKSELPEIESDDDRYIVQEYLNDNQEEYTVGVFSDGEKIFTIIFKRKLEHGYTSFVELVHDKRIEQQVELIAKGINLKGFINIQLRKKNRHNYIFEINPRISGTVFFRHMLGFTDVLWWLDLLDNRKLTDYRCKYETAIGMRELSEKFIIKK